MTAGDKVVVFNTTPRGHPVREGIATLRKRRGGKAHVPEADGEELWDVEFDDEPGGVYPRFVYAKDRQHCAPSAT